MTDQIEFEAGITIQQRDEMLELLENARARLWFALSSVYPDLKEDAQAGTSGKGVEDRRTEEMGYGQHPQW